MFKSLYPDKSIIPKMHYMVHYPSQILTFGPLIYTWTMRHGSKLSVLKRASSHRNFKNISYTVAKRHQHFLWYNLSSSEPFVELSVSSNCRTSAPLRMQSSEFQQYIQSQLHQVTDESLVSHPQWFKYGCLHLKPNVYVYMVIWACFIQPLLKLWHYLL